MSLTPENEEEDRQMDIPVESPEEALAERISLEAVSYTHLQHPRYRLRYHRLLGQPHDLLRSGLHRQGIQCRTQGRNVGRRSAAAAAQNAHTLGSKAGQLPCKKMCIRDSHSLEKASSLLLVRLACVRRAASVRPEPGSNSL